MARLLVHVEGQTEETFVNNILSLHLITRGYESVGARIIGNARLRRKRGGICPWPTVKNEITRHLRNDAGSVATTMVDFYGLPQGDSNGWPGRAGIANRSTATKASTVEQALSDDIANEMGANFNRKRFVPFVLMHEFEGLLFSDCAAFAEGVGRIDLERKLRGIRDGFPTPEDINDSPTTAPSKRIQSLIPGYEKPLFGAIAVLQVGLAKIRSECPHFDAWLKNLESLSAGW
jgi:hypothetical protein